MCVFDFISGFYCTIVTIILNFAHVLHIFNILTHLYRKIFVTNRQTHQAVVDKLHLSII